MGRIQAAYLPPRVVKGSDRWYIKFYAVDPATGRRRMFRPTFDLNRILNRAQRETRAEDLCRKLAFWLEKGYPPHDFDEHRVSIEIMEKEKGRPSKMEVPLARAIEVACDLKNAGLREITQATYRSICRLLVRFYEQKGLGDLAVGDFSVEHASEYMDHCIIDRGVSTNTYNNNLRDARVLFNVLVKRGYLAANPFLDLDYRRREEKIRRRFTPLEARSVIHRVQQTDRLLYYGLVLQYACAIRPAELRRMRFGNLHLDKMLIRITGKQEKNHRSKTCTIPKQFYPIFQDNFWTKHPTNYLIFGENWAPHPTKSCGEREMNRRHRKILQELEKDGLLESTTGLSWYSWKDTGLSDIIHQVGADAARGQAGHATEAMTRRYYHELDEDHRLRGFESGLFS